MINVTRGACEDSRGVEPRVANPPRNVGERRVGDDAEGAETEEASYYYQFACLRSLGLPLSSFHLVDTEGLISAHIFLGPNKRSAAVPPSTLLYFFMRTLSRNFVQGTRSSTRTFICRCR